MIVIIVLLKVDKFWFIIVCKLLISCFMMMIGLFFCLGFVVCVFLFLILNLKWLIVEVIVFDLIVNLLIFKVG